MPTKAEWDFSVVVSQRNTLLSAARAALEQLEHFANVRGLRKTDVLRQQLRDAIKQAEPQS